MKWKECEALKLYDFKFKLYFCNDEYYVSQNGLISLNLEPVT